MATFLQNRSLHELTKLLASQYHFRTSVCQLHSGSMSQRFWNLLHLSVNKTNPPENRRCNVVTNIDANTTTTIKPLPAHDCASLTKKPTQPIYTPRQSAYTFVNKDVALPMHHTGKRYRMPNEFRDAVPLTPWHPTRAPDFPKPCCPALSAYEVQKPEVDKEAEPIPSPQTNPGPPDSNESCQTKPCPPDPVDSGPRPKPTSCSASENYSSTVHSSNAVKRLFYCSYEPPKMAKRNVLWTFLRNCSSLMRKTGGSINKSPLLLRGSRPHRLQFHLSSIRNERHRRDNSDSGRTICAKGGKAKKKKSKCRKCCKPPQPGMIPGKTICTKPKKTLSERPRPQPPPQDCDGDNIELHEKSFSGGLKPFSSGRGGSSPSRDRDRDRSRPRQTEQQWSSKPDSRSERRSDSKTERRVGFRSDNRRGMYELGSKDKRSCSSCHPDESWKERSCSNAVTCPINKCPKGGCKGGCRRAYSTTTALPNKPQTKKILIVPMRSIKSSERMQKKSKNEEKKEEPEVTAESLTKEILDIEERIAALKYGTPLKKKKEPKKPITEGEKKE